MFSVWPSTIIKPKPTHPITAPIPSLPSTSIIARLLNVCPNIPPARPSANRRIYDSTSPSNPDAMLYVSQRPAPIFANTFLRKLLSTYIPNAPSEPIAISAHLEISAGITLRNVNVPRTTPPTMTSHQPHALNDSLKP